MGVGDHFDRIDWVGSLLGEDAARGGYAERGDSKICEAMVGDSVFGGGIGRPFILAFMTSASTLRRASGVRENRMRSCYVHSDRAAKAWVGHVHLDKWPISAGWCHECELWEEWKVQVKRRSHRGLGCQASCCLGSISRRRRAQLTGYAPRVTGIAIPKRGLGGGND